jgi:hypothetical protein
MGFKMDARYSDARQLINKVLALGDAPAGDFGELLQQPHLAPLTPQGQDAIPEDDQQFIRLMDLTASIVSRLTGPKPSDSEIQQVYEDAANAGLGWTWFTDRGKFLEVSKPYAEAMAEIIVGFNTKQQDHVKTGLEIAIGTARTVVERQSGI